MVDELFVIRDINRIDLEIERAQKALRDGVDAVKTTTARVAERKQRLATAQAELERLQTEERENSRRLKELTAKRDRTKQLIDSGRAPDYEKATQQLQQQNDLADEAETALLITMEEREAAEAELAEATASLERARTGDANSRRRYKKTSPGLKKEIADKTALRPALLDKIEPNRRRQYSDLRRQGLDAIAHVVKGACNHCFQSTPPQTANEIRGGRRIHNCRGCGRFFFAVRDDEPQAD